MRLVSAGRSLGGRESQSGALRCAAPLPSLSPASLLPPALLCRPPPPSPAAPVSCRDCSLTCRTLQPCRYLRAALVRSVLLSPACLSAAPLTPPVPPSPRLPPPRRLVRPPHLPTRGRGGVRAAARPAGAPHLPPRQEPAGGRAAGSEGWWLRWGGLVPALPGGLGCKAGWAALAPCLAPPLLKLGSRPAAGCSQNFAYGSSPHSSKLSISSVDSCKPQVQQACSCCCRLRLHAPSCLPCSLHGGRRRWFACLASRAAAAGGGKAAGDSRRAAPGGRGGGLRRHHLSRACRIQLG